VVYLPYPSIAEPALNGSPEGDCRRSTAGELSADEATCCLSGQVGLAANLAC